MPCGIYTDARFDIDGDANDVRRDISGLPGAGADVVVVVLLSLCCVCAFSFAGCPPLNACRSVEKIFLGAFAVVAFSGGATNCVVIFPSFFACLRAHF
jgi:hypothetical protein